VLKQPPPHALLDGFGESTLDFVLRVYMPSRDVFLQLRHELLTEISRQFAQAGIEIAFPQRDIHVRWRDLDDAGEKLRAKDGKTRKNLV
jgi:potassium efflux system protein